MRSLLHLLTFSVVVIEDNFFVGVKNPIYIIGGGIAFINVTRNNIVDSMGEQIIAVKGENNGDVLVEDNFIAGS